ncbi:hypothetical protein ACHAPE_006715 [Trichoderma viride]
MAHFARYEALGLSQDLDKAIGALQPASLCAEGNRPQRMEILNILGCALRANFEFTRHPRSLQKVMKKNRELPDLFDPSKNPEEDDEEMQEHAANLRDLGACLQAHFEGYGERSHQCPAAGRRPITKD